MPTDPTGLDDLYGEITDLLYRKGLGETIDEEKLSELCTLAAAVELTKATGAHVDDVARQFNERDYNLKVSLNEEGVLIDVEWLDGHDDFLIEAESG